jgi:hypothetical protein
MADASFLQENFLGGEWSPFFQGRARHPKYATGMNVCRNSFPLEEGAWVRRPGTKLKGATYLNQPARVFPIEFVAAQPYDLELSDGAVRLWFGTNLVYTSEGAQPVTSVSTASPALLTLSVAPAGWATGDEIQFQFSSATGGLPLRGKRTFIITKLTNTTFTLADGITQAPINGATLAMPGGSITVSRVLRLATPYVNGSWANCRVVQNQDLAIVLNPSYQPYILTLTSTGNGLASAVFKPVAFEDGPYLDQVPNAQLTVTGGTVMSANTRTNVQQWSSSKSYGQGANVIYNGLYYAYDYFGFAVNNPTSPVGVPPPSFIGWKLISASAAFAALGGTITISASFVAWDPTVSYGLGAYVSFASLPYQSINDANLGNEPDSSPTFWARVPIGTEVTGPFLPSNQLNPGFQASDVGRLVRLFVDPPAWDQNAAYPLYSYGDIVTYLGTPFTLITDLGTNPFGVNVVPGLGQTGNAQDPSHWIPGGTSAGSWGVITAVIDERTATVFVQGPSLLNYQNNPQVSVQGGGLATPVLDWQLGVYSDTTGWPTCGSFYESRLWLGGARPNRFDTSQTQGFDKNGILNMAPTLTDGTVVDASGISYILQSKDANPIVWFEPDHNGIAAGTLGGEWLIQASTLSDPITPTSIQAKRVTRYGCANVEPKRTGISLVFIQKYGHRVMELLADVFTGRYIAPHLNESAKHLSSPNGISEIGYQEELAPILWAKSGKGPQLTQQQVTIVKNATWDPIYTSSLATLSNNNLTFDGTPPAHVVLGIAVDLDAKKFWLYNPWFGGWNLGTLSGANPALGTGAMTYTLSGQIFPAAWVQTETGIEGSVKANFGGSAFLYPVPTGFVAWDPSTIWDSGNTGANATLSGGNLIVSGPNAAVAWGATRTTTSKSSGKWYWEITLLGIAASNTHDSVGLGMVDSSANMNAQTDGHGWGLFGGGGGINLTSVPNGFLYKQNTSTYSAQRITMATVGHSTGKWFFEITCNANANDLAAMGICNHLQLLAKLNTGGGDYLGGPGQNSIAAQDNGGLLYNGGSVGSGPPSFTAGKTYGIAVDLDHYLFWIYDPVAAKWNNGLISAQNPAANLGGSSFSPLSYPVYPAAQVNNWTAAADEFTLNCGSSPFVNTIPNGYTAWAVSVVTPVSAIVTTLPGGNLVGATYRRVSAFTTETPAFVGWHRHDLGHLRQPTSIGVGAQIGGLIDVLDMVTTDGTYYYVESMTQVFDEDDVIQDAFFLDGAIVPDSAYADTVSTIPGVRFTGLWPFVGKSVTAFGLGLDLGEYLVDSNGTAFIPYGSGVQPSRFDYTASGQGVWQFTPAYISASLDTAPRRNGSVAFLNGYITIAFGYPFTSQGQILRAMLPEQSGARTGPALGKKRRQAIFSGLFQNAKGLSVGADFSDMYPIDFADDGDTQLQLLQLFSGVWRDSIECNYNFDAMMCWQITRPYPASIVNVGGMLKTQDN